MKNTSLLIFLIVIYISCSREKQFPEFLTQKVSGENLTINILDTIQSNQIKNEDFRDVELPVCLKHLSTSVTWFKNKNLNFSLKNLEKNWEKCRSELSVIKLNDTAMINWVDASGLLLQLSAEARYAEALEQIFLISQDNDIKKRAAVYAITKNVDHLHVNLFIPAKIEYDHSLGGHVKMLMETNYPESGEVQLKFNTEKNRYIELFIRIPSWEQDAHVTVKGVKYLARAGTYCKIAKKWKDGDVVEIVFPHAHNHDVN